MMYAMLLDIWRKRILEEVLPAIRDLLELIRRTRAKLQSLVKSLRASAFLR